MYDKQKVFLVRLAYLAALLALGWVLLRYVLLWLLPFVLALGLAILAEPLIAGGRRRMHLKRSFLAAVLTGLLVAVVLLLTGFLFSQLLQQSFDLLEQLPRYLGGLPELVTQLEERLDRFCSTCPPSTRAMVDRLLSGASQQVIEWLSSLSTVALQALTDAAAALPQVFLFCATTALALFFTAERLPSLLDFLRRRLSDSQRRTARGVKENLLSTLGKWLKAQCILLTITFFELLAGLLLLRQPYALLLSVLIALIDALPVFGTGTILIPWAALCLLAGFVPKGIALLALYAVITLVRSITEPKIMAAQVDLPPLAALLAMYVGFCAAGVAGMIFFPVLLLFGKQLYDGGYLPSSL